MQALRKSNKKHPPTSHAGTSLRLDAWLPYRLFLVSSRVAEVLSAYYGPRFGLSHGAWRVMAVIANQPGASGKEITRASGLDQFGVSRAIMQLTTLGFARRHTANRDKRYAAVQLTDTGWTAFEKIAVIAAGVEGELKASMTEQETALLDRMLKQLDDVSAGIHARGWQAYAGEDEVALAASTDSEPT